jgi:hypothetical protein
MGGYNAALATQIRCRWNNINDRHGVSPVEMQHVLR